MLIMLVRTYCLRHVHEYDYDSMEVISMALNLETIFNNLCNFGPNIDCIDPGKIRLRYLT